MDSIKINLVPRSADHSVTLIDDLGTALVAYANFTRTDGSHSGISLGLQASPKIGAIGPDAADTELYFRLFALLNTAPKLLAALQGLLAEHDAVFAGRDDGAQDAYYNAHPGRAIAYRNARAAIAAATTHPLQEQMEAAEIAYEESQEMARARRAEAADHDDDRDHLTDDNTDFGDDLDEAARAYSVGADDIDPERLQDAADHARKSAIEERLLGGAA